MSTAINGTTGIDLEIIDGKPRITGDFSNGTWSNQVALQSSTTNGNTTVSLFPNGSATQSGTIAWAGTPSGTTPSTPYLYAFASSTITGINSGNLSGSGYLPMAFYTGGAERMRIDTSGNVGIGRTPTATLDVSGTGATLLVQPSNVADATIKFRHGSLSASSQFVSDSSGNLIVKTNDAERMRIDTAGRVGIGASSVQAMLHVKTDGSTATPVAGIMWTFNSAGDYRSSIDTSFNGGNSPSNNLTVKVSDGTTTGQTSVIRFTGDGNSTHISPLGGLGYGTGAGGTVTQATSKATEVTLDKPTGRITMNAASLAANTEVTFNLNNSILTAADVVVINFAAGTYTFASYQITRIWSGTGTSIITLKNVSAGALAEAVVLSYAIIKGSTT